LKYSTSPENFEEEMKMREYFGLSQPIYLKRLMVAFYKAVREPNIGIISQLAFDLFHMLFRDQILDLQTLLPRDHMVRSGRSSAPFWCKLKRYPRAIDFDVEDEAHRSFISSTTRLFGTILGIFPCREAGDSSSSWLSECRSHEWVRSVVSSLSVPAYIPASSPIPSISNSVDDYAVNAFELPIELRAAAQAATLPPAMTTQTLDLTGDDSNFHASFITAASNLRCDNFAIKRSDLRSCTAIASGKPHATLVTTTSAVCGLATLELFKIVQNKPADDLMVRQIGLGANNYFSFNQEPPKKFTSFVERTEPNPFELEGVDAYDDNGVSPCGCLFSSSDRFDIVCVLLVRC